MREWTEIIGSAARYTRKKFASSIQQRQLDQTKPKQTQAWGYWDDTPEVRFGGTWLGNSLGRARLIAGRLKARPSRQSAMWCGTGC